MNRLLRYGIALVVASVVTGTVAAVEYRSSAVLAGIFALYAAGAAISLRYPILVRNQDAASRVVSVAFVAGAMFGGLALAEGPDGEFRFGVAVLSLGLAFFGLATGVWMADVTGH